MCGIAGLLDPRRGRSAAALDAVLEGMAEPLRLRGPDGGGRWLDETVGLGFAHRRLSILDLSDRGAQPMVSSDGRFVLSYNGEIYDHRERAQELTRAGVRLHGHSDTEVLLEAIVRWGLEPTLERVDGMFAFALWDRQLQQMTLVRDRMGEKPLFYGTLGSGEVVFASSLDALRAHPHFDRPVDRDALALYFRYKYVPAPWSIFAGIRKLEPGHLVQIDATGTVSEPRPYWSYFDAVARGQTFAGSEAEAVEELGRLLRRSVARRLVADVPVGAFLSGGIDSSLITAVAQHESNRPLKTFTIGSTVADYDESADARAVAGHLGTEHTELMVTDEDALAAVSRLPSIYDEPFGDSSGVPTLLVSELARAEVTVALSGDGGDELFAGYNRYVWVPAIWDRLGRTPQSLRARGARAGRSIPPRWWDRAASVLPSSRRPRMVGLKVSKVLGIADAATAEEVFHRLVSHWQEPTRLVPGAHEPPTIHTDAARWPDVAGIVEHMSSIDTVTYLPDDVLAKVDRATMAVSLECRVPLLDRAIVEFAAGLPLRMKLRGGRSKWVLRELLSRSVPSALFERPKSGFGVPIEAWLRGPLSDWAGSHIHGATVGACLDRDIVTAAWDEHRSGRRDLSYELWDVVMFAAWCDERGISPD